LGLRFLRHIERNSLLLFVIPIDSEDIKKEYTILLNELKQYNPELLHKDRLLAITKSDMLDDELIQEVWEALSEYGIGRKDLVINLGGGVVTDMGGFIASTLEPREMVNGFAEVLKHALIKDADLWNELAAVDNLSAIISDEMLQRIISVKLSVVNEDPTENGMRKILNFGHTIGHAIE
ncbi:3-dehydroquinate synthase, partial [Ancylostoma ceylanicum]